MMNHSGRVAMLSHPDPAGTSMRLMMAGATVLVAAAIPFVVRFGATQSVYMRPDGHTLDYAVGLLWAALIAFSVPFWPVRNSMKFALLWAWLLRVFITLCISLAVFSHYSWLDSYRYFGDRGIPPALNHLGFAYGTQNIIAMTWMVNQFIPDSFHATNVTFALFSLIGVYWFWIASEAFLGFSKRTIFWLLVMEPSLTFWTASLGKESLMTLAVGLYTYAVVAWWRSRRGRHLLQAAIGIAIAGLIRTWMAAIMIAPLLVLLYSLERGILIRILTTIVIAAVVNATLPFILESMFLQAEQDITEQVATISERFNLGESAGTAFMLNGPLDLARYAPLGMFSALFRPLPGDVMNAFGLFAGMENLILLGLLVRAVVRSRLRDFTDPLVCWLVALVFSWALIYAFVSSQNFGTGVRYRTQILPIFLGLMLYLGRNRRVTREANFLIAAA